MTAALSSTVAPPASAVTRPTCDASIGKRATDWGFEPVTCGQTVGLVPVGDAHHACARFGHRENVVRQFGEGVAEPVWPGDLPIDRNRPGKASPRCESGGRYGCTCDVCW